MATSVIVALGYENPHAGGIDKEPGSLFNWSGMSFLVACTVHSLNAHYNVPEIVQPGNFLCHEFN